MLTRISLFGLGLLGVLASFFAGESSTQSVDSSSQTKSNKVDRVVVAVSDFDTDQRKGERPIGSSEVSLDRLRQLDESNERLSLLLKLMKQSEPEDFPEIYQALTSDYERQLMLHKMCLHDGEAALDFVREMDADRLDLAMAVVLRADPDFAASAWAAEAEVKTKALEEFEENQISDQQIDDWLAASREAREQAGESEEESWISDLPSGKTIIETAKTVVKLAASHSDRSRYWLTYSRNSRARIKAAGDIGWESDDLGWDEFDDWLLTLPIEVAEAALAGRLERLAADHPENSDLIRDTLDRYRDRYELSETFYLMVLRLVQQQSGQVLVIADLIGEIRFDHLREEVELVVFDHFGPDFGIESSSSVLMQSSASDDWLGGLSESAQREWATRHLEHSYSESRGIPGGVRPVFRGH